MENQTDLSRKELERALEEAKKKVRAMLNNMTPEERAQAEKKAREAIAADHAATQKLIDEANAVMDGYPPQREMMERNTAQEHHVNPYPGAYVPNAVQDTARVCPNCGAKAERGKFCEYCGSAL